MRNIRWANAEPPVWTTWKIYLSTLSKEGRAQLKEVKSAAIVNAFDYVNELLIEHRGEGPFESIVLPQQIGVRAVLRKASDPRDFRLSKLSDWTTNPHETKEFRIYVMGDSEPIVIGPFHGTEKSVGGNPVESIRQVLSELEKAGKLAIRLQIAHTHPTEAFVFQTGNDKVNTPDFGELSVSDIKNAHYYKATFPLLEVEITAIFGILEKNLCTITYTAPTVDE